MLPLVTVQWWRPYTPGRGRWLIIGWELGGLALAHWSTVRLFDITGAGVALLGAALGALWLLGSWRIIRMGVYVSEYGVRIYGLAGSRTLRWRDIAEIALDQPVFRLGSWSLPNGTRVLIKHRNGEFVNTSLWAQGIDFHAQPRVFREVYGLLQERHIAALAAGA